MKKLLLASTLFLFIFNLSAQEDHTQKPTDKGRFIADGSAYFSTNNSKSGEGEFESKTDAFGIGVSPKAGYFIIDRLALGLETSFNYSENKYDNNDGNEILNLSRAYSIGPFAKYYLTNNIFGQASVGFGRASSEAVGFKSKRNLFRYQIGVGYAIFLGQQVSLEPVFSYQYNKTKRDGTNIKSSNSGFTLGIGFTIFL